jgi:hypothetical protein
VFVDTPAHLGCVAFAAPVERAFSVREAGIFPAGLCVADNCDNFQRSIA